MKRQDIITALSDETFESIADDYKGLESFIRELVEFGYRGFSEYSDEELIEEYAERFDEDVTIEK